ncbi:MAG: DNA-formamidopyrimidine glycosylase family protein, partial [Gammaproteobacteria bacterium]
MPEGDTVFKVAAYLAPRLEGRRLIDARAGSPPVDLTHSRIEAVEALGKHLLITLEDGRVLRSHLGMWGSWHWYPRGVPWHKPAGHARILL